MSTVWPSLWGGGGGGVLGEGVLGGTPVGNETFECRGPHDAQQQQQLKHVLVVVVRVEDFVLVGLS